VTPGRLPPGRRHAIGLDLGGGSAKVGLVDVAGEVAGWTPILTPSSTDPEVVLGAFAAGVERMLDLAGALRLQVVALGCGVPGNLDPSAGTITINNIRALDGFPVRDWLVRRFGLPTVLDNDSCAAAIGELSALRNPPRRCLFVAVGTGIGVVLLVDGEVVRLFEGVTGDASHLLVNHSEPPSDLRCALGCRGCLETVASGLAIDRDALDAARRGESPALAATLASGGTVAGRDVSVAAESGDVRSREIILRAGRWLGIGLASWAVVYRPEVAILGGGVARAGEPWRAAAEEEMLRRGIPFYVEAIEVRLATLGNTAGMIGAALSALRRAGAPRA